MGPNSELGALTVATGTWSSVLVEILSIDSVKICNLSAVLWGVTALLVVVASVVGVTDANFICWLLLSPEYIEFCPAGKSVDVPLDTVDCFTPFADI